MIHAVSGMIRFGKLKRPWHAHRDEFALAAGALLGVVVVGVFAGVAIGVALSLALLIHRLDTPRPVLLGRNADGTTYRDLAAHDDVTAVPGTLICRVQAPLIFANADIIHDALLAVVDEADPEPRTLILDLGNVPDVDSTGSDALLSLHRVLAGRGIALVLARATGAVRDLLDVDGVLDAVGTGAVFPTVRDAVGAREASTVTTPIG